VSGDLVVSVAFYLVAAITIVSAIGVVAIGKIVHSAIFLFLTFAGVAATYVLLSAEFVAAVQVLIYAGAVIILILFAIWMTQGSMTPEGSPPNRQFLLALSLGAGLFVVLAWIIFSTAWPISGGAVAQNTAQVVGKQMLTTYVLPFEIAAVLLTAAMIGAILIARED